jgi:hypothetical protein
MIRRRWLLGLAGLACAVGSAAGAATPAADPRTVIGFADFDYLDTSGEVVDQRSRHRALVARFGGQVRAQLAATGHYAPVGLDCAARPCSAGALTPEQLFAAAASADAELIVYGGVHKMSTLVQWIRVEMVDVDRDELLMARTLTFRGDSDLAWDRAAENVGNLLADWLAANRP